MSITLDQAVHNMEILDRYHHTLTADHDGNLSYIAWYNLPGILIQWIKNLIDGSDSYRCYETVLKTFEKLNEAARDNPNPSWTYNYQSSIGFDFDVGFDKIAMGVLTDYFNFPVHIITPPQGGDEQILYKIKNKAFDCLLWCAQHRNRLGMGFCNDHLPSPSETESI